MDPKHRPARQPTEIELRRLLAGDEPVGLGGYLVAPQQNAVYARGTGALDLGQFTVGFGRHLIDKVDVPDHNVYVTLDEYLPRLDREAFGLDSAYAIGFILRQCGQRDLLTSLAVLNRLRADDEQAREMQQLSLGCLTPEPAAMLRSLLNGPEPRQFLGRQPIVLAIKEVEDIRLGPPGSRCCGAGARSRLPGDVVGVHDLVPGRCCMSDLP